MPAIITRTDAEDFIHRASLADVQLLWSAIKTRYDRIRAEVREVVAQVVVFALIAASLSSRHLPLTQSLQAFHVGDTVSWHREGVRYLGRVMRVNAKTLSVIHINAGPGFTGSRKWRVAPSLCTFVPRGAAQTEMI